MRYIAEVLVLGILLALVLVLATGTVVWHQRKRLTNGQIVRIRTIAPPRRAQHVVLVHGFAGFSELRLGGVRAAYFRGVRERIEALGVRCTTARLPSVAPIAERSAALEELLASLGDVDVHVIAHSMGGLDARRAVRTLGGGAVRSLVTVATPHRGTPLADLGDALPLRLSRRTVRDLSRASVEAMNRETVDVPGVRYASIVACPVREVHPLLRGSHLLLRAVAGENDGVVPVSSQAWGEVIETIDADHWGAIGWSGAFDAPSFYERIVREVCAIPSAS